MSKAAAWSDRVDIRPNCAGFRSKLQVADNPIIFGALGQGSQTAGELAERYEARTMSERVPMTRSGYEALKTELKRLKTEERPKNVKDIEEALAHGDLSENAEYHAAKERQSHIAGRIEQLDDRLARAQIIEVTNPTADKVQFGATVVLMDVDTDEEVAYRIVGEDEADPRLGMISVTSPVARALMNRKVDDEVVVKAPKGDREFEIRDIRFD
jgi:transcription elongation factor GreA